MMSNFPLIKANSLSLSKRRSIHGVGINDAEYIVQPTVKGVTYICPYYTKWCGMIKRCYSDKYQGKYPSYIGCTVINEWLIFSKFKEWMESQDWKGKELDKDLLIQGNKIYSPEACMFVSQAVNSLLVGSSKAIMKRGISRHKKTNTFNARVGINGKRKSLGYFKTKKEASEAYKTAKSENIVNVANEQCDVRIKNLLLKLATNIKHLTVK
jgi:hypothetical protein